jgi:hypothetical protein
MGQTSWKGKNGAVGSPGFLPEAVIAGRNPHAVRAAGAGIDDHRHDLSARRALRYFLRVAELRSGRGIEVECTLRSFAGLGGFCRRRIRGEQSKADDKEPGSRAGWGTSKGK